MEKIFTDKSNTAAAFSFLKEIEERKRKCEPEEEDTEDPSGKVVFKKPKARQDKGIKINILYTYH